MSFTLKKKYELPLLEIEKLCEADVIKTSDGVDSPIKDDPFGEWEI